MVKEANSPDVVKWLCLTRAEGVGPVTFKRLLKHFKSIDAILGSSSTALSKVKGIGPATAEKILRSLGTFDIEKELELAAKNNVWLLHYLDKRYPAPLRQQVACPPVLYVRGTLKKSDNLAVAIVGSRRCSIYGKEQASRFAYGLASSSITIVSGMARGIDTAAHQGALNAGGRTIAVLGCGLSNVYPPENKRLHDDIAQSGAVISELPMQVEPKPENFPARNRIIAALAMASIIAEAGYGSGAMITAKYALEMDREVMAIPGRIDSPMAKGPNSLIKQGAKLIEDIADVMDELGSIGSQIKDVVVDESQKAQSKKEAPLFDISTVKLSEDEKTVYDNLSKQEIHCDTIIETTGLGAGKVNASLMALRLKGLIKQLPGNFFKKR
ncbi:MAG: DNA-processing protein DprA [Sedimentisphaeraceae bacterium JB056]